MSCARHSASVRSSSSASARGDHPADLRDLEAVGQADAEVVAVGSDEHLGLAGEAAEGDRVDDPVAVALERAARAAGAVVPMLELTPARGGGIGGVGRGGHGRLARGWRGGLQLGPRVECGIHFRTKTQRHEDGGFCGEAAFHSQYGRRLARRTAERAAVAARTAPSCLRVFV